MSDQDYDDARIDGPIERFAVGIDTLTQHPDNARRGRVDVIADSLSHHGQFRPIIVRKGTNEILAGNHTWKAAKDLGWSKIAAVFVEVTDARAREILLIDNKAADGAFYDEPGLLDFLDSLPDLAGTGFDDDDLEALRERLAEPEEAQTGSTGGGGPKERSAVKVRVGDYAFAIEPDEYDAWDDTAKLVHGDKAGIVTALREALGLPPLPQEERARRQRRLEAPESPTVGIEDLLIPIDSVEPYPGNPRSGDVELIMESLARGQYRPILVNQRTLKIIGGNHTWLAAKRLGWTQIAATFMDANEEEERRRLIVDNRASDVAKWDDEALHSLFERMDYDTTGTGFLEGDLDALEDRLSGKSDAPPLVIVFGKYRFSTPADAYTRWRAAAIEKAGGDFPTAICRGICEAAGLNAEVVGAV